LLVEDNPDDVEITRRAVARALPCEIEVIGDGATAVARLRGVHDGVPPRGSGDGAGVPLPDLILLDLRLPAMGGLEVLKAIRTDPALERTPVMMLTSEQRDDGAISDAYASGSNSYFAKPATRPGFAEALRALALGVTDAPADAPADDVAPPSDAS
jgi:CheY-like chemotaxis protein